MPNIADAIQITVTIENSAANAVEWGVPCIVGEQAVVEGAYGSGLYAVNTPKLYTNAEAVKTDHGEGDLYNACVVCFNQGVRKLYAMAVAFATPGTWVAETLTTSFASIHDLAVNGSFSGMCLAGTPSIAAMTAMKTWADTHNIVFTATNVPVADFHAGISTVVSDITALASRNGVYLACANTTGAGHIAAAALGVLMTLEPWISPYWDALNTTVTKDITRDDIVTIEAANGNGIVTITGYPRFSNGKTTLGGDYKYIDITRTQYYAMSRIKNSLIAFRLNMAKIPYTNAGIESVKTAIESPLETMKRAGAISEYSIVVPDIDDIAVEDKADRILSGVTVNCTIPGDIFGFAINMNIQV